MMLNEIHDHDDDDDRIVRYSLSLYDVNWSRLHE